MYIGYSDPFLFFDAPYTIEKHGKNNKLCVHKQFTPYWQYPSTYNHYNNNIQKHIITQKKNVYQQKHHQLLPGPSVFIYI